MQNITHLILGPGGMKGIYYIGVMRYMYIEKMIENIKYISGTSIGAFFAVAIALRIPVDYLEERLLKILIEKDKFNINLSFSNLNSLFEKKGLFNLDFLVNIIKDFLKTQFDIDDISFLELTKKLGVFVYVSCSCIDTKKPVSFSFENTPNVSVLEAMRASMSCPLIFEPVIINKRSYVDGVISFQYSVDNCFTEVADDNKIYINISETKKNKMDIIPNYEKIGFLKYVIRTIIISYSYAINIFYNKNSKSVLYCNDLSNGSFDYKIIDNNFEFVFDIESFDFLILKGFVDISNHMKNRLTNKYKDKTPISI